MYNTYLGITLAHWLILVSVALSLSGTFVYVKDILKGKSKPNRVSWGLCAFAPLITTGAALAADADGWATVRIFMSGFGPLIIFLTSLFISKSYWKLGKFDYVCGLISIMAIIAWLLANSPILAILLAALADLFATLPTVIKTWRFPETESLYTYFIGFFSATIIIPAIQVWNIENAAFQIYIILANVTLFSLAFRGYIIRKRKLNNVSI